MAKALRSIEVRGIRYSVLKLSLSKRGPRYLLRDDEGRIFGAWVVQLSTFRAQLLGPCAPSHNPLEEFEFADAGDHLTMRKSRR